jgi:hypothetical protein
MSIHPGAPEPKYCRNIGSRCTLVAEPPTGRAGTISKCRANCEGAMVGMSWKPLEVTPRSIGVEASVEDLAGYLRDADLIDKMLVEAKALVFRGFGVPVSSLDSVMDLLLPNRLAYVHGNSPRTKVGNSVYTSTEYPAEFTISMHNELSYAPSWPTRLLFFCERPSASGGATPLVDGERWLASLDEDVRTAFSGGVRYTQNLHDGYGLGKSWQDTFETSDRQAAESYLAGADATWAWQGDGTLRVSQTRPATVRHPATGAEVWFNQADQWHAAALGDDTAKALAQILPEAELPQSVRFADGGPNSGRVRDPGP